MSKSSMTYGVTRFEYMLQRLEEGRDRPTEAKRQVCCELTESEYWAFRRAASMSTALTPDEYLSAIIVGHLERSGYDV